jgi:transcriptional regulator with PAS, ATPase and Fis domain
VGVSGDLTSENLFFKKLLDNMQIGIIVSDAEGRLIYINPTYSRFLNINIEDSIGRHATEVISNTRLHIVAKTGQAEINFPHKFKEKGFLVHRIPIQHEGKVIAVLGLVLFDSASTAVELSRKLIKLESRLKNFQKKLGLLHATRYTFDSIIGACDRMRALKAEAVRAASNDLPVLISGESGTGKELFAHAIHGDSARRSYPFVQVNCAAIPKGLLESELFGYEKGSFTGADPKGKIGKFEMADMGTIFLDEIGDLPLEMQPKLLRVLELKEFERVGGVEVVSSDFRVIAATNQDLRHLMQSGLFRRDLYYRLNVVSLEIPPLRDRPEDILPMAYHFVQQTVKGAAGKGIRIHSETEKALKTYSWPGNGRELLHALQQVLHSFTGDVISPNDLPKHVRSSANLPDRAKGSTLADYLAAAEKYAIQEALIEAGDNKSRAADILGIHRTLLYRKMKKLDMSS